MTLDEQRRVARRILASHEFLDLESFAGVEPGLLARLLEDAEALARAVVEGPPLDPQSEALRRRPDQEPR